MLPQITTNINTSTTILDIPSKTYKLNIDSEANAPYELDTKNKVYFRIKKEDGYLISSTGTSARFNYNELNIDYTIKLTYEFEFTKELSTDTSILGFVFGTLLDDYFTQIFIKAQGNLWKVTVEPPNSLSYTMYYIDNNIEKDTRFILEVYIQDNTITIYINSKKIFTFGVINSQDFRSSQINYKNMKLYNFKISDITGSTHLVDAYPYYKDNKYCLLNKVDNTVKNANNNSGTYGEIVGHLYAYPQSEDSEISFSITDGHLIGESENIELLKKYYRLNYNIYFRTLAYNERIMGNVDGLKAVEQAVYKILMTERYAYLIYSNDYGVELEQYIGKDFNYLQATIENTLREALTYDLRIKDVEVTDISKEEDRALVKFNVYSIYGDLQMEVGISV